MTSASRQQPAIGGRASFAVASLQTLGGLISNRFLAFGLAIATARLLGSELFGEYSIVQSTAQVLALALGQPLGVMISRYSAELWPTDRRKSANLTSSLISTTVLGGVALGLGLFLGAGVLAEGLYHNPRLAPLLAAAGLAVVFHAFYLAATGALRGYHWFHAAAGTQALQALIGVPLAVALVWRLGLPGAVLGLIAYWIIGATLGGVALGRLSRRHRPAIRPTLRLDDLRRVAPHYLPYLLTTLLPVFSLWFVRAVLARGDDAFRQVGLFSAALQYSQLSQILIVPIALVATPTLTTAWNTPGRAGFRRTATDLFKASFLLLTSFNLLAIGCAPWLLAVLGGGFDLALRPLELLLPAMALYAFLSLIGPVLLAIGQPWRLAGLHLASAALFCSLTLLLSDRGASGAALAFLLAELGVVTLVALVLVRLRVVATLRTLGRMGLWSLPALALGVWAVSLPPPARVAVGAAAAVLLLPMAFFGLEAVDRASLIAFARRVGSAVSTSKPDDPR